MYNICSLVCNSFVTCWNYFIYMNYSLCWYNKSFLNLKITHKKVLTHPVVTCKTFFRSFSITFWKQAISSGINWNKKYMSQMVRTSSWGLIKGCIKLRPKSMIPNSLCFLFLIPKTNWQHKSSKFYSEVLNSFQYSLVSMDI